MPPSFLFTLGSNLDPLIISNNNMDPLVATLTVLINSSLFLVLTIAKVATNKVSRSIMRSVPRRKLRVRNLPKLQRLRTAFESDEFLSEGVLHPLWEKDGPEVVVQSA